MKEKRTFYKTFKKNLLRHQQTPTVVRANLEKVRDKYAKALDNRGVKCFSEDTIPAINEQIQKVKYLKIHPGLPRCMPLQEEDRRGLKV